MSAAQAGVLVGRLQAHYPGLAENDLAALDWVEKVRQLPYERAVEVVELLIVGWTRDRAPRLADWQEVARQVAARVASEQETERRLAVEAGPHTSYREQVAGIIARARGVLADATPRTASPRVRARVSKYDRDPIRWGMPGTVMDPEDRAAQLAECGDRKVRRRIP